MKDGVENFLAKESDVSRVLNVQVFRPIESTYTYLDAEAMARQGALVEVPLGRTKVKGIVRSIEQKSLKSFPYALKGILKVFPAEYDLRQDQLELADWMSKYYHAFSGEVLPLLGAPSPLLKSRELVSPRTVQISSGPALKKDQLDALEKISQGQEDQPVLLHGITGSGKTEIFLRLVDLNLEKGRSCIYLLPEITLTRETLRKLRHRYDGILIFHSGMTQAERRTTWLLARQVGPHLIVGARSALFAPVENLGLIVVDEEHDGSYKQDSTPRYQARDCAVVRGKLAGAKVILGSATPSMESYQNALSGKYQMVSMLNRISQHALPAVKVVDLKEERRELKRSGSVVFSRFLIQKAKLEMMKGRQMIFFLNRRGYSTAALCPACGHRMDCPHCDVAMTHYRKSDKMICHHCDHRCAVPDACPACDHRPLQFKGIGTEKLMDQVEKLFPDAKVIRVDGAVDGDKDIQSSLESFMEGDGQILLGTQIISKGLDSPNITLSVALNADLGLSLPDFRAAERDFQMLTQLAGRVGRGDLKGQCLFQSHEPEHYAIRHAITQDYDAFFKEESLYRQQLSYPPYSRMARWVFQHGNIETLIKELNRVSAHLRPLAKEGEVQLLGPVPAPLSKIKSRHRYQLVAKSQTASKLGRFIGQAMSSFRSMGRIDWYLDRDPQNMM